MVGWCSMGTFNDPWGRICQFGGPTTVDPFWLGDFWGLDQLGLRQTCCRSINGTLCDESAPANQAVILSHSEPFWAKYCARNDGNWTYFEPRKITSNSNMMWPTNTVTGTNHRPKLSQNWDMIWYGIWVGTGHQTDKPGNAKITLSRNVMRKLGMLRCQVR